LCQAKFNSQQPDTTCHAIINKLTILYRYNQVLSRKIIHLHDFTKIDEEPNYSIHFLVSAIAQRVTTSEWEWRLPVNKFSFLFFVLERAFARKFVCLSERQ
jgi:hypothetical protein